MKSSMPPLCFFGFTLVLNFYDGKELVGYLSADRIGSFGEFSVPLSFGEVGCGLYLCSAKTSRLLITGTFASISMALLLTV